MTSAPLPPLPEPFFIDGEHIGIVLDGGRALFTTRRGGHSHGPYASLNLGRLTGDDPAAVEANRALLERGVGRRLVYGRQVHGVRVQLHGSVSGQSEVGGREPAEADAHATADPALAPLVLAADCLPVAIAGQGAVAMIHAGWRGLAAGVIASGVAAVRQLGARGPLQGAIGPGAGPCCYQVGEEVIAAFDADARHVHPGRRLDLKAIAAERLRQAGIEVVHDLGLCTICSPPSLFFSHRRDHGVTGRQGGVAWLS
jgi:YfiH family protein